MSAPGEYGGVSTSDETLQSTFSSTRARLQAHAAKLKKSILEGTVELATLGTIGAVLMVFVSATAILGNITRIKPASALLMVYCVAGGIALLVLEFSASPPSFLGGFVLHRLRKLRQMLHFECHILTVATGRALCYLFFGSLLLADAGSALGTCVGGYLAFVGLAMLYVSRSAVAKLRALMPRAAEASLRDAFARHDSDSDGKLSKSEFAELCEGLGGDLTPRERECALSLLDVDGSGTIELDEFLAWYTGRNWQMALPRARASPRPRRARPGSPSLPPFLFSKVHILTSTAPRAAARGRRTPSPAPRRCTACRRPLRSRGRSRSTSSAP